MERIRDLKPIDRVRLSSIEPFEFTDKILEQAATIKNILPAFSHSASKRR